MEKRLAEIWLKSARANTSNEISSTAQNGKSALSNKDRVMTQVFFWSCFFWLHCCAHRDDGDSLGNDDVLVHPICKKPLRNSHPEKSQNWPQGSRGTTCWGWNRGKQSELLWFWGLFRLAIIQHSWVWGHWKRFGESWRALITLTFVSTQPLWRGIFLHITLLNSWIHKSGILMVIEKAFKGFSRCKLMFPIRDLRKQMETFLQTYCFEIEVTCAKASEQDAFVRRMALHLVQYLAVFLAETITELLQRVLTHPTQGFVDESFAHTEVLVQAIYTELLCASSRHRAVREQEKQRPPNGLVKVVCLPFVWKPRKRITDLFHCRSWAKHPHV